VEEGRKFVEEREKENGASNKDIYYQQIAQTLRPILEKTERYMCPQGDTWRGMYIL
jgi:hypothetical protein